MVYLVNISPVHMDKVSFPVGLGYLSKALKRNHIDFKVIDLTPFPPEKREEIFKSAVLNIKNAIIGFGIIIGNRCMETVLKYAKIVKMFSKDNIVVFGGPLSTAIPEILLKKTPVCDYVIAGEGEERFPQLIASLNKADTSPHIDGVFSRASLRNNQFKMNYKKISCLDDFAPPAYDCFDMDFYTDYYSTHDLCFEIMASRGCRGSCSYCFKFVGKGFHSRSADSLLNEIEYVQNKWGFFKFTFLEENLIQNKEVLCELIEKINKKNINFKFRCSSRVDDLEEDILNILSDANAISISFGLESLNQKTLNKVNKGVVVKEYEKKIDLLHKRGIQPRASFIVGFPDDTEKDLEEMYDFIERNGIKGTANLLTALPRTRLYHQLKDKLAMCDEWEYIKMVDKASLYNEMTVNFTSLSDETLLYHKKRLSNILYDQYVVKEKYNKFMKS